MYVFLESSSIEELDKRSYAINFKNPQYILDLNRNYEICVPYFTVKLKKKPFSVEDLTLNLTSNLISSTVLNPNGKLLEFLGRTSDKMISSSSDLCFSSLAFFSWWVAASFSLTRAIALSLSNTMFFMTLKLLESIQFLIKYFNLLLLKLI